MLRIGIDIGGTFTDFVVYDPENGKFVTYKLLTDTTNPALTVLQGLHQLNTDQPFSIIHGSTVATNALLERKGARTALITTRGFKDVLEIGRQNRPSLYDWTEKPAPPLVPAKLRFEVDERIDYQGKVLVSVDLSQVDELTKILVQNEVESVAVCFLFSFIYPIHEKMFVEPLRKAGYPVSASSEILPEFREYERISTTVVNAYVSPIMDRYLSKLEASLPSARLQIMQSNGGMMSINEAKENGARCILSGPAGGIVGAQNIAQALIAEKATGHQANTLKLITFDMGGTSTDVSLIDEQPGFTTDASVGGCPIHLPLLDIHTIGAGGGSIAYVDAGGALRVGPQSAGANPGPACYGQGELPTVTDANLVLGRLIPDHFLGGKMKVDPGRAFSALSKLGAELNLSAIEAAYGVIEVVNAQMEHALRVISVERGHDPRDFSLFSFGGAGGLHAVLLARRLGIPEVIISKFASTLSAYGMLASNVIKDYVKTVMLPATVAKNIISDLFTPMITQGKKEIASEGIKSSRIEIQTSVDVRFSGQSYELKVPYSDTFIQNFHKAHRITYGYTYDDKAIEIVNLRVRAIGIIDPIHLPQARMDTQNSTPRPMKYKSIELLGNKRNLPVYDYVQLMPGFKFTGPALIVSSDTTILIQPEDIVNVDSYQNLLIDVSRKSKE
jgi:N-methylhydantoinase A